MPAPHVCPQLIGALCAHCNELIEDLSIAEVYWQRDKHKPLAVQFRHARLGCAMPTDEFHGTNGDRRWSSCRLAEVIRTRIMASI